MIKLRLPNCDQPIFILCDEDPHNSSFTVLCGDTDITELISNLVREECRQEVLLYHSGLSAKGPRSDEEYDSWKEMHGA
jgi:hypothetical protein